MSVYKVKIMPMSLVQQNKLDTLVVDEVAKVLINILPKDMIKEMENQFQKINTNCNIK